MKIFIAFSILSVSILCGCNSDTSSNTEVVPATGKTGGPPDGKATDPNIPAGVKQVIPPTGK